MDPKLVYPHPRLGAEKRATWGGSGFIFRLLENESGLILFECVEHFIPHLVETS